MRRIIYQSLAAPGMDRAELFRLVYHARVANQARGLSGFLLFSDQRFLQVLEGRTWKLLATFDKIRRDVRHCNVEVLDERSIPEATFEAWRMRCFHEDDAAQAIAAIAQEAQGALPKIVETSLLSFFGVKQLALEP
ncbi:MAG: BLUF domain-containing protein [Erythrobacter sp.]